MGYFRDGLDDRYFIVPVQLRADVRADVRLPKDLTAAEARKVAAVIMAYAPNPIGEEKPEGERP